MFQTKRELNYEVVGRIAGMFELINKGYISGNQQELVKYRIGELFHVLDRRFIVWLFTSEDALPSQRQTVDRAAKLVDEIRFQAGGLESSIFQGGDDS